MRAFYKFSFDRISDNILVIDAGNKLVEEHLWNFPITFLATDFQILLNRLKQNDVADEQIKEIFAEAHTFLEFNLLPLAFEEKKVKWLEKRLESLIVLQKDLIDIVENVFIPEKGKESLSALQRLCAYLDSNKLLAVRFYRMSEFSKVETVYYIGGKEFIPQVNWHTYDYSQDIQSLLMFGTDNLETALFFVVQRMAERNVALRRCDNCGRIFHPFSVRSIYCDHTDSLTGKSCKEQAAKLKYVEKIATNDGRVLFQRRSKTYSMRVSRYPDVYKKSEYLAWRNTASIALEEYISGKITYEDLDIRLTLPDRK